MASLEELKKRLYRRDENFKERTLPPDISQDSFKAENVFSGPDKQVKKINFSKLMGSKIFLATVGTVVIFIVFIFFSSLFNFQNVDLKIEGQKDIQSGEKVIFSVIAKNRNKRDIKEASLVLNIPALPSLGGPDVFRERINIGLIKSGDSIEQEFETIIFGGRGKNFEARALLEYKPEGSSSFFAEEEFFSFVISQSPVTVSFLMPDEVRVGEDLKVEVRYFSQSDTKLSNLFLKVDYPLGFEYKSSDRKPAEEKNIWEIGDLDSGKEGSISIFGILNDAGSGVSNFGALIGTRSGDDFLSLDETSSALLLRLPYLGVDILPKGEKEKYKASIGEEIPFLIGWRNNLPEIVEDASLEVSFFGGNADLNSIRVRDGSFISKDKKIIWNPSSYKDFISIFPGKSGFVGFSLKIKKDISLDNLGKNNVLKIQASFKPGKPISGFEGSNISGEDEIEIPISSAIQFSQKGLYFETPIPNAGPLPPKVGQETTYTITWSLANPLNDIKNLVVKSTLPPYASFKEIFIPSSANVVFDKNTGVLEWRVGTFPAGTGFIKPALSLSFQIGIIPSITHISDSPQIISQAEVSGIDSFTEKVLSASQNEITTDVRDDPQLDFSQKKVVQ